MRVPSGNYRFSYSDMTPRQQSFVSEYVISGNGADAARRAGYSEKGANVTGAQLLANPSIRSAIAIERQKMARNLDLRKEDVVGGMLAAINMAQEQRNPGAMIRGFVQLATLCGFYDPERSQIDLWGDAARLESKLASMSDDELFKLARPALRAAV